MRSIARFSKLAVATLLLFLAVQHDASAQSVLSLSEKSTNFTDKTILKAKLLEDHYFTIRCAISKGKAREYVDEYSDLIDEVPAVGPAIKFARKLLTFEENDAVCSLVQSEKQNIASKPVLSSAKIYVRTWNGDDLIGEESAWLACKVSSFCYEIVWADGDVTGLSACIETKVPGTDKAASFVVKVNNVPNDVLTSAGQANSYQAKLCKDRTY